MFQSLFFLLGIYFKELYKRERFDKDYLGGIPVKNKDSSPDKYCYLNIVGRTSKVSLD